MRGTYVEIGICVVLHRAEKLEQVVGCFRVIEYNFRRKFAGDGGTGVDRWDMVQLDNL
jgi:hypothetical protein